MKAHSRAFATMSALILMIVMAVAVLSLTRLTVVQAGRTRREVDGAQLRQVVLAVSRGLCARLSAGTVFKPGEQVVVALPPQLERVGLATRIQSVEPDRMIVLSEARTENIRLAQRMTFLKAAGVWRLDEVEGR